MGGKKPHVIICVCGCSAALFLTGLCPAVCLHPGQEMSVLQKEALEGRTSLDVFKGGCECRVALWTLRCCRSQDPMAPNALPW